MDIALQLWPVKEQITTTPQACLSKISDTGIKHLEGFDVLQLQALQSLLRSEDLSVKSCFLYWLHITENHALHERIKHPWEPKFWGIEHEIEIAHQLGLDTLVMGYWLPEERQSLDDYKRLADQLNIAGEKCASANISLLYHNHNFEFSTLESEIPYHVLIERTDEAFVGFEFDAFWAQVAGHDPVETMEMLGSRLKQLHLKSAKILNTPSYDDQIFDLTHMVTLDKGDVDTASIIKQAIRMGLDRYIIDQDYLHDTYQDIQTNYHYIKQLLTAQP